MSLAKIVKRHRRRMSFGERASDAATGFFGSWKFIIVMIVLFLLWAAINTIWLLSPEPFDPYPFILLNLMLSFLATVQLPLVLMAQNRTDKKDRRRAQIDLDINRLSEREIKDIQRELKSIKRMLKKK